MWKEDMLGVNVTIGRVVTYRGKMGLNTLRPAMVVCTLETLDPRGVESGEIQNLDDHNHVHLQVFTPSQQGMFFEQNVPYWPGLTEEMPPGHWTWPTKV